MGFIAKNRQARHCETLRALRDYQSIPDLTRENLKGSLFIQLIYNPWKLRRTSMLHADNQELDRVVRALRRHTFTGLIRIFSQGQEVDAEDYSYSRFVAAGKKHDVKSICRHCENAGCSFGIGESSSYHLRDVSHGAHSVDFFQAVDVDYTKLDKDWRDDPVMFLYENPASDEDFVFDTTCNKAVKNDWYWVQLKSTDPSGYTFPNHFGPKKYGEFVLTAMNLFRLRNVYVTNLVKCGLSDKDGSKFVNLYGYHPETIKTCYSTHLMREIEILSPKVIFVLGSNAQWQFRQLYSGDAVVQDLPHPASRALKAEYFLAVYFWLLLTALSRAGILNGENEVARLVDTYLERV